MSGHQNHHRNDAIIDDSEASMRTTIALDDELIRQAQQYTGITEKAALIKVALTQLVQREAARRLAALGGSDPDATAAPRRRTQE
jgi:Arc/MetJ family transcription regulator